MRSGIAAVLVMVGILGGGYAVGDWLRGASSHAAPTSCPYSGGGPPFSLHSFEADRARMLYRNAQLLAAANRLFPGDEEFQLPPLVVGDERREDPTATIPPEILFAIGWIESKANQTSIEVPYGDLGPALISFDCGYGLMQVTSSIINDGGLPSRYEALVGTHFAYNIAAGARILAEKWNDPFFPSVGARDPAYIESWYYALWGYNGWAGVNHPMNPSYDPMRSAYQCDDIARNEYPYQELVLGCIINPPMVDGVRLWDPLDLALPDLDELGEAGVALDLEVFYAGQDSIYLQIPGGEFSPFAEMDMALPAGAEPRPSADVGELPALRSEVLGDPVLRVNTEELELTSSQLQSGDVPFEIHNDGSGLLAWRIEDAPSWLDFDIQAGVALGEYDTGNSVQSSRLRLTAAVGGLPEGSHRGQITFAFEFPDGQRETQSVAISLDKRGAASYEAGRPQS